MTSIIISHKLNEISYVADKITVIRDGAVIKTLDKSKDDFSENTIIAAMVGRDITDRFPKRASKVGDVCFEVKNWCVDHPVFDGIKVCDNVNFNLRKGEVLGISGLMGAGRTELAMSIFGHSYGANISGQIFLNGKEIELPNVKSAISHKIAYVTEDRKGNGLILSQTITQNTVSARPEKVSKHGIYNFDECRRVAQDSAKEMRTKCATVDEAVGKNEKVNKFLKEHNSKAHIIQGYGMTETTGPATFGAKGSDKLGSVGIPLPGNKVKIINRDTMEEVNTKEIGEICISGPTVMSRYLNNREETNAIIKKHPDNIEWVHTGDLGYIDEDGVLFFLQRLKRMIISSGYNVYPSHIEEILQKNELVEEAGVIGIPHPYKIQVPKAYIVLKKNISDEVEAINKIKKYCEKNLSKYMIPKYFVIRKELPKTLVGKINYKELEKEQ